MGRYAEISLTEISYALLVTGGKGGAGCLGRGSCGLGGWEGGGLGWNYCRFFVSSFRVLYIHRNRKAIVELVGHLIYNLRMISPEYESKAVLYRFAY